MKAAVWYYNRGSHAVRPVLHSRLLTYLHHPQVIMGDAGASLTTPIRAGEVKVRDLLRDARVFAWRCGTRVADSRYLLRDPAVVR